MRIEMTVLHRKGGIWHQSEVGKLASGLITTVSERSQYPEYIILWGHYTKEATLKALVGGQAYTATKVTRTDDKRLPFIPD